MEKQTKGKFRLGLLGFFSTVEKNNSSNFGQLQFGQSWFEAGATFDNSFFDNYFDFLRQFKNGSFLGPVFVHVTGWS